MRAYKKPRVLWVFSIFVIALAGDGTAQEVLRLTWPTRHAAPSAAAAPEVAPYLPFLRAGADRMPESAVVNLALTQSSALGLSSDDAEKLRAHVNRRYQRIAADPLFGKTPSTLAYCFAAARPTHGLALAYRPEKTDAQTPVILFLHGYGGSFLWYLHQLAEWFPRHIILAPAHGVDTSEIAGVYLDECMRTAATRLGHPLAKPALVGLSAGGFGATRVYVKTPTIYRQLVVIAAYPPDEAFRAWPRMAHAGFVVGEREYYVKDGGFAAYAKSLAARSSRFQSAVIPEADHFFMLTHAGATERVLRSWLPPAAP